jgi:hypothetical protein
MPRPAIALLRKDLRIMKILWAPMAFSYGVFLLMFMENTWVYLATGVCLSFVAAATALGIDDRYRTEPLFAALPGTRRDQVFGRYLAWGLVTTACLGLFLTCTALFRGVLGARAPHLASLVSPKGIAAFLGGALLSGLVFLPFHFRLGFWRGMWWFAAAGLGLSIAVLNAAAFLVPAEAYRTGSAAALPGPFFSTGRGLRALAWLIDRYSSRPAVIVTALALVSLLVYFSYRVSVRFHEYRDL